MSLPIQQQAHTATSPRGIVLPFVACAYCNLGNHCGNRSRLLQSQTFLAAVSCTTSTTIQTPTLRLRCAEGMMFASNRGPGRCLQLLTMLILAVAAFAGQCTASCPDSTGRRLQELAAAAPGAASPMAGVDPGAEPPQVTPDVTGDSAIAPTDDSTAPTAVDPASGAAVQPRFCPSHCIRCIKSRSLRSFGPYVYVVRRHPCPCQVIVV